VTTCCASIGRRRRNPELTPPSRESKQVDIVDATAGRIDAKSAPSPRHHRNNGQTPSPGRRSPTPSSRDGADTIIGLAGADLITVDVNEADVLNAGA